MSTETAAAIGWVLLMTGFVIFTYAVWGAPRHEPGPVYRRWLLAALLVVALAAIVNVAPVIIPD